ncbi:UNVERIFIED_CONTAM: hypothetical protein Scaly_1654900 [Sesamum calycinum]|uniref:Reverse transcriptase zinc-binding domain-containing protein n=1 Tax=Sesamum calycinum TaxID=2727403 RepID=A0AAW2NUW7_9LAMI
MKSAYNLACGLASNTASSHNASKWDFVWGLILAPKIMLFIWKVCQRAVPTLTNLHRRAVRIERGCVFCDSDEEEILHILMECTFARLVWALSEVAWKLVQLCSEDIEEVSQYS